MAANKNAIRVMFNDYMSDKYGDSWYALFPSEVVEAQYEIFRQGALAMAGLLQVISERVSNEEPVNIQL